MAGTNFKVKNGLEIQSGTLVVSNGAGSSGQVLKSTGTGVEWGTGSSGSGDVVGPASSTDNAVTRFDSTTGKLIQNSTVTLDDNGNFDNVNSVVLDNTPATLPTGAGTIYWEDGEGTPEVILKGGNTLVKVGTQEYARVYNDSGSTVTKGQVVYISGAQGNRIAVKLARADVEATSYGTLGFVAETITNGAEGWVIVSGALYKLNTLGLTAGATVYLSTTTAGAYTTTKPQAPDQLVVLGFIERVSSTVGSIYVKVDNGYELDELHDVRITSPISGNTLIYDATTSPTGVWKNASLTAGTGISVTNGAGSITIGNTGVTSVSGTSPVVSSGTATPAISLASGYGDTQNPYGSKTANYFLASPNGSAGVPTWRSIVAADIPTLNQNTTGTAANITASSNTTLTSLSNLATVGTITSGTWSGSFGAVSGANLTSLTAGNLSGTIPSGVLGNSTLYVGTTAVALNRASANQALTGISSITLAGATSGTVQFIPTAAVGTGTVLTIPATTGTIVTTGDSGTVTSTMIADGTIVNADINASAAIAVSKLSASTISGVTLGGTLSTLTLNTSGTGLSGSTTYNGSAAATFTVTSNATSSNTASTIVARDASGNFSAGTITATLSGNASTATSATSATTATNLSGGSVAATTGTFSGTVTIKSGSALGKLTVQTGGSDPLSPSAGDMVWYY
jgi:hypothetical protein